jgi:hypothetical protein
MDKKYRLKIPDMIRKQDAWMSHWLETNPRYGNTLSENYINDSCPSYVFESIPKDWLEEVKDEPKSPEELFKNWDGVSPMAKENNELRHREATKLEDVENWAGQKEDPDCQRCWVHGIRHGWKECKKSHGWKKTFT